LKNDKKHTLSLKGIAITLFLSSMLFSAFDSLSQQLKWHYGQNGLRALRTNSTTSTYCPPNIDFENGDFTNWQCYTGIVQDIGTTNVITMTPSPPTVLRHKIIPSTSTSMDAYGNFPVVCPNGSGNSVLLGNNQTGSQAERISYTFTIPAGVNEYSITYWYAVVFQNPGHQTFQQPRFQAKVYADGVATTCASFDFTSTAGLPGFHVSTNLNNVLYKEWSPVSINLSGNAGKTIMLEFTTVDCTEGGHFGYAYVDVNSCDASDIYNDGSNFCEGTGTVTASGPPGFQGYTWYSGSVSNANIIGTGEHITITPPPVSGSLLAIDMVPYPGFGCRDTVYAIVKINPRPKASFVVDTTQLCISGNSFQFTSTSTIDSGTMVCNWKFGDGGSAIGNTTSHTFSSAGVYTVKLYVTSGKGCLDSFSKVITVLPKPQPVFQVNTALNCLIGNSFPITNTSTLSGGGAMSYSWSFGDVSSNETIQNPVHSYAVAGNYTIKLVVTSNNGCKDSTSRTVTVDAMPTVNLAANTPVNFCVGSNAILAAIATPNSGFINSYKWYRNGLLTSMNGTTITVIDAAKYHVVVSNSKGCSSNSDTMTTAVFPLPTGSITNQASLNLCDGSSLALNANGGNSYQWFLNGTAIAGAVNANYAAMQEGVYTVRLQNVENCQNMANGNVTITIIKKPVTSFGFDKYCVGLPTQFMDSSITTNSGIVSWHWDFGDNSSSALQHSIHSYLSATSFNAKLTVVPTLCPNLGVSAIRKITMELPNSIRYTTVNAVKNQPLQLMARNNGKAYQWQPGIGLNNGSIVNPVFNYINEQEYKIKITTFAGCQNTDTILVRIFDQKNIYVPKAFTPNRDGSNDELYPFLVGIKQLLYFRVYNRWGQLMYSSNEMGNKGWNGKHNGVDQPTETYAWIAEGIAYDGTSLKATGNTILIR
jgi:gliding motility-associated-like protein